MVRKNEGSLMIWVLVVLAVLSMVVVVYARMINLDYQIGISQYKQLTAEEMAFSGLAIAQEYFSVNSGEVVTFYNRYGIGVADEVELYPNKNSLFYGLNTAELALATDLSIESIKLIENVAGDVWIQVEGSSGTATRTVIQKVVNFTSSIQFTTVTRK